MDSFDVDDDEESIDSIEYAPARNIAPAEICEAWNLFVAACVTSHLNDRGCLSGLKGMWESVLAQVDKLDLVSLSLSCAPELLEEVEEFQKEALAQAAVAEIHAFVNLHGTSAMEPMMHLRSLANDLLDGIGAAHISSTAGAEQLQVEQCWLVFGDDAIMWHPLCVRSYRNAARMCSTGRVLLAPVRCRLDGVMANGMPPQSIADVEKLLESGDAALEAGHRVPEYFDYAVRLDAFQELFARIPDPLLRTKHADMAVVAFLESIGPNRQVAIPGGGCWMCAYRERLQRSLVVRSAGANDGCNSEMMSQPRSAIIVLPRDRERAMEQFDELAIVHPELTVDDLIVAVACCREWIEGLCATMWLGGPYTHNGLQLLARSALKNVPPPIARIERHEALSDWSFGEVRERFIPTCEELGLLQADEVSGH